MFTGNGLLLRFHMWRANICIPAFITFRSDTIVAVIQHTTIQHIFIVNELRSGSNGDSHRVTIFIFAFLSSRLIQTPKRSTTRQEPLT